MLVKTPSPVTTPASAGVGNSPHLDNGSVNAYQDPFPRYHTRLRRRWEPTPPRPRQCECLSRPLPPLPTHASAQAVGSIKRYSRDAAKEVLKGVAWLVTAAQEEVLPHRERLGERAIVYQTPLELPAMLLETNGLSLEQDDVHTLVQIIYRPSPQFMI